MGTRGLTGFVIETNVKASYQQYDSDPSGVGLEVLAFARTITDLIELRKAVAKVKLVPEAEEPTADQITILKAAGYTPQGVSTGSDWYAWLREDQGRADRIAKAPFMMDSASFADSGLFCEYGYLIDLDTARLEAYVGFQKDAHTDGRFAKPEPTDFVPEYPGDKWWAPIRLAASWPLSDLPTDEEFENTIEGVSNYYRSQDTSERDLPAPGNPWDVAEYGPEPIPGPVVK